MYLRRVFFLLFLTLSLGRGYLYAQEIDSLPNTPLSKSTAEPATNQILIDEGKGLFEENCTVCHKIHEKYVGPALKDVHKRRSTDWFRSFVRNSQKMIEGGDPIANQLYKEFNQTQMTSFDFSDQELDALIAYIATASTQTPSTSTSNLVQGSGGEEGLSALENYLPSEYLNYILAGFVLVLLLVALTLRLLSKVLYKNVKDSANLDPEIQKEALKKTDVKKILKSKLFLGIMVFLFLTIVLRSTLDGLYGIGVQQGYQPTQPIAFSHKVHAGEYEIDCNYCHTGVRKARAANIPSVNICLNCHGEIKKDSPEIQKLYKAVQSQVPIEWVRVHNLPDLAYFNHSQHVEVGKIDCETCHGAIKEMDVVYQYAPLTMGWCINCHKETEVNSENAYYDAWEELHNPSGKTPLKVEDIGGLECSKCHY
ncbi:MAG: c-type cytochrome [Cytophagales bacterium]|nr:c-type cytochrome [Cytophagales bacterium]